MKKITSRNVRSIILCSIISLLLMIINHFGLSHLENDSWRIFSISVFSTIATVLLGNVLWEIIVKENFARSLLDMVRLSQNIAQSGIDTVYIDFRDINWKEELANTKSFTAAFTYAYSWRSHNDQIIKRFASNRQRRGRMRIIVPDPEIDYITGDLDARFNFEKGECYRRITDCVDYFVNQVHANVYLYKGTLQSSYYLLDAVSFMSFFTHRKEKGAVPAIKAKKNGNLYNFIAEDIASMIDQADQVESIEINIDDGVRTVHIRRKEK